MRKAEVSLYVHMLVFDYPLGPLLGKLIPIQSAVNVKNDVVRFLASNICK